MPARMLIDLLREAQRQVHERREEAASQLRRWRAVYYAIGLISVVAAATAGVTGLADLVSIQVAGGVALGSAILGAVDKFLGAGGRVGTRERM